MKLPITRQHLPVIATIVSCLLMYFCASLAYHEKGFNSLGVFLDLFSENAVLGVTAVGMSFVILSGGIDLSVGAVIGLVSISTAVMVSHHNISPWVVWPLMLVCGMVVGTVHGVFVTVFDLPPFLVTLAGMFCCRGIAMLISLESVSMIDNATMRWISRTAIVFGSQPPARLRTIAIIFLVVLLIGVFVSLFTRFGRNV